MAKNMLWALGALVLGFSGCGKNSATNPTSDSGGVTGSGGGIHQSFTTSSTAQVHIKQSFTANTPQGFRASTTLNLDALGDACDSQYGRGTSQSVACQTMGDIKNRFFSAGPTQISAALAELDSRLNSLVQGTNTKYVPCVDTGRTPGTYPIDSEGGGTKSITFPAFALTNISVKTTFKNGTTFDTGLSLNVSCQTSIGSGDSAINLAFGYANGTWSLYEETPQQGGYFGTIDSDDNIELWLSLGDPKRDSAQDGVESATADPKKVYAASTHISQIISKPKLGLIGMSVMGSGIGPGCGAQLLMNASTLYFRGNVNGYGACYSGDIFDGRSDYPSYTASRADVEVCMNVDGTTLTPSTDGLDTCVRSGLLSRDSNEAIVSPFASAGLKYLTTNSSSTTTGALKARAWMGSFFMHGTDLSTTPLLGTVTVDAASSVSPSGLTRSSWELTRTTAASTARAAVSAACNADTATRTAAMNETYELSVASILSQSPRDPNAKVNGQTMTDDQWNTSLIQSFNTALQQTGTGAPTVDLAISGAAGTTYRGTFSGTMTVLVDGTQVGTASFALPASNGKFVDTQKATLQAATLTATSKIQVKVTGNVTLSCDNAISTTRHVGAKPGLPHLVWYLKKSN